MNEQQPLIHTFNPGEWLFHSGDPGVYAYLVEEGEVVIALEQQGQVTPLAVYGPGSLFGEMALIDKLPRSAGALTISHGMVRKISRDQLDHRMEQSDPILKVFLTVIMGNMRKTLSRLSDEQVEAPQTEPALKELLQEAADEAVRSSSTAPQVTRAEARPETETSDSALSGVELVSSLELDGLPRVESVEGASFKGVLYQLQLEQALELAIKNEELTLFYQPIIETSTGRLGGFEALIRWIHPKKGMISPADFIPIAERSGLIVSMTRWIIGEACDTLVAFREKLLGDPQLCEHISDHLFVSVNFSSRDFLDEELMAHVHETLAAHQLPRNSLKIEITESVLMSSPEQVREALNACKERGASVAIDDFGTGYSSLSYLQSMPADTLKIDQAFIRPMHKDDRHMALVESIIHLAQRLNMNTVAEGIETQADVDALTALRCELLQGYFFGRPMPFTDVISWANKRWGKPSEDEFLG